MEGKEIRLGIVGTGLFTAVTTGASCGAINGMMDSLTPLGGAVPLVLMQLGEVVFGGVGTGLYNMLVFAIMAVFIAGLMIGRTPEYLGKKIESFDMKMACISILVTPLVVLLGTAVATMTSAGVAGVLNRDHLDSLKSCTPLVPLPITTAVHLQVCLPTRLSTITCWQPPCGWAGSVESSLFWLSPGSMAAKKKVAVTSGTLPTHGPLFITLLIMTVLLDRFIELRSIAGSGPGCRTSDVMGSLRSENHDSQNFGFI